MTRTYTLRRRADQKAETRQRIIKAAVGLHGSVGPAATTFSMVAERAGVQRHTLYAHFPDERSLFLACSGYSVERDPLPDAAPWQSIEEGHQRLQTGLEEVYSWYMRNAELAGCVLRDAETHALTREMVVLRFGPAMAAYQEVLGANLSPTQRAMLRLSLSFFTWRSLARDSGLATGDAAWAMVCAIDAARPA